MIPKIIHYCWFGRGEKPKLAQKCIESWKTICPDYEIVEWNEDNFDVHQNEYLDWCYKNKKWAYLSDLARLIVVYENGGIYFDTDVELLKRPDAYLNYDAFYGFENNEHVATGLGFGAVKNEKTVYSMIEIYRKMKVDSEGQIKMIGCPTINTEALLPYGLQLNGEKQVLDNVIILPEDYLNPYDDPTGKLNKTANTISVHWYSKSALTKKQIIRSKITQPFHRWFGTDCFRWLK